MSIISHSFERHRILDQCLRDTKRKYYFNDLWEEANRYTLDNYGTSVSKRTVHSDLAYMKSETGYKAPIKKFMDGHWAYYRYSEPSFSILNLPMTNEEANLLSRTLSMLQRFNGLPENEWLETTLFRLNETFNLTGTPKDAVVFAQNPDLKGLQFFAPIFKGIKDQKVLKITYHKFNNPQSIREIHPYQLRQYNNRWFLIGYEPIQSPRLPLVVVPLDRIDEVSTDENIIFQRYQGVDLEEYFDPIIGVSIDPNQTKEKVVIRVSNNEAPYIATKPIHASQIEIRENDLYTRFEYHMIINYELRTFLLGLNCEIIAPQHLRQEILERAQVIIKKNQ